MKFIRNLLSKDPSMYKRYARAFETPENPAWYYNGESQRSILVVAETHNNPSTFDGLEDKGR